MRTLIWWVTILTATVAIAMLASFNDGYTLIVAPPYRIELSLNAALVLLGAGFVVVYGGLRLLFVTMDLPNVVREYHERRNADVARNSLTEALAAFFEGRYNRAEKAAARAFELDQQPDARIVAGLLAARSAHIVRAFDKRDAYFAQVDAVAAGRPNLARWMTAAELMVDARDNEGALAALAEARAISPKLTAALRLELKIRQRRNEPELVLRLLEQLQKSEAIDAPYAERIRQHANLQYLQLEPMTVKQLREWWNRLPEEDRVQPALAAGVVRQFINEGECELALGILTDALNTQWNGQLVELFGLLHEVETPCSDNILKHIQLAESWLPKHPNDATLLLSLGRLCRAKELWGKAQSYLEASLAVAPSTAAHIELAQMLEQLGRPEEAVQHIRDGLELTLDID